MKHTYGGPCSTGDLPGRCKARDMVASPISRTSRTARIPPFPAKLLNEPTGQGALVLPLKSSPVGGSGFGRIRIARGRGLEMLGKKRKRSVEALFWLRTGNYLIRHSTKALLRPDVSDDSPRGDPGTADACKHFYLQEVAQKSMYRAKVHVTLPRVRPGHASRCLEIS